MMWDAEMSEGHLLLLSHESALWTVMSFSLSYLISQRLSNKQWAVIESDDRRLHSVQPPVKDEDGVRHYISCSFTFFALSPKKMRNFDSFCSLCSYSIFYATPPFSIPLHLYSFHFKKGWIECIFKWVDFFFHFYDLCFSSLEKWKEFDAKFLHHHKELQWKKSFACLCLPFLLESKCIQSNLTPRRQRPDSSWNKSLVTWAKISLPCLVMPQLLLNRQDMSRQDCVS